MDEEVLVEEKSSWRDCFTIEHFALGAIYIIIIGAIAWFCVMSNLMKSPEQKPMVVTYEVRNEENTDPWYRQARVVIAKSADAEVRSIVAYREAEEHLREQMNAWLTIVGFFGVVFGLLTPLISYLMQKRSLSSERMKIFKDVDKRIAKVINEAKRDLSSKVNNVAKMATEKAEEAKKAAETVKDEFNSKMSQLAIKEIISTDKKESDFAELGVMELESQDKAGKVTATYYLAKRYLLGNGVARDEAKALDLIKKAAQKGYKPAIEEFFAYIQHKNNDGKNVDEFVDYLKSLAEKGIARAQAFMGVLSMGACGCKKDLASALVWAAKAAKTGDDIGYATLGCLKEFGYGVPQDESEAASFYAKAAEREHSFSQLRLGMMYAEGRGVPKNLETAYNWCEKAARDGDVKAQEYVADALYAGNGVERDIKSAILWAEKAFAHGSSKAKLSLAKIYSDEKSGHYDISKAKNLYESLLNDKNEKFVALAKTELAKLQSH